MNRICHVNTLKFSFYSLTISYKVRLQLLKQHLSKYPQAIYLAKTLRIYLDLYVCITFFYRGSECSICVIDGPSNQNYYPACLYIKSLYFYALDQICRSPTFLLFFISTIIRFVFLYKAITLFYQRSECSSCSIPRLSDLSYYSASFYVNS